MSDPVQQASVGAAIAFGLCGLVLLIGWLVSKMGRFHE